MDGERVALPRARFSIVLVLQLALVFWLVASDRGRDQHILLDLTSVVIPLSAILVASDRRRERRFAFGLAAVALVFNGAALSGVRPMAADFAPLLSVAFSAYTTWVLMAGVVRNRRVTGDVLAGALAAYIMAGLAFGVLFGVVETRRPEAFQTAGAGHASFPDLVYFSFVTLMTIGFGDVTPVAPVARAFVLFEGLFGVVYTTIVMASLVAGYLRQRGQDMV